MLKRFYLVCAVIGTVIPWLFFANFFATEGFNIPFFVQSLFANGAAGGFVADVLISIVVFLVWSFTIHDYYGFFLVHVAGITGNLHSWDFSLVAMVYTPRCSLWYHAGTRHG